MRNRGSLAPDRWLIWAQIIHALLILYHGSNIEIMKLDLSKCKPYKDFGRGFYLTTLKEQAARMAKNRAALYEGNPIITGIS